MSDSRIMKFDELDDDIRDTIIEERGIAQGLKNSWAIFVSYFQGSFLGIFLGSRSHCSNCSHCSDKKSRCVLYGDSKKM